MCQDGNDKPLDCGSFYVGHGVPEKSEFDWEDPENKLCDGDLYLDQETKVSYEFLNKEWVILLEDEE